MKRNLLCFPCLRKLLLEISLALDKQTIYMKMFSLQCIVVIYELDLIRKKDINSAVLDERRCMEMLDPLFLFFTKSYV